MLQLSQLGDRQHQPHQVRLPGDVPFLVDRLQEPIDGVLGVPRGLGHVVHALAFRQPDRHSTDRSRFNFPKGPRVPSRRELARFPLTRVKLPKTTAGNTALGQTSW